MTKINENAVLADVGEKELVKIIIEALTPPTAVIGGRGNDATALDLGLEKDLLLLSIDRCPTPLAYQMEPSKLGVWGDLAITCVSSDLLASGARPIAFLTSLLLPGDLIVTEVLNLMHRAEALAKSFGASVVAGDTKEAQTLAVITTGLGLVPRHRVIHRHGARPGDVLILTGEVGAFTAAHLAWKQGVARTEVPAELFPSVFQPKPAYEAATNLFEVADPKAGMDLSDGLLSTVFTLAEQNNLGITIKESSIPIAQTAIELAHRFSVSPLRLAFGTGDWQIAYAVDRAQWEEVSRIAQMKKYAYPIGEFTSELGVRLESSDGKLHELRRIEQQHFAAASADKDFLAYLLETPLFV